MSAAELKHVELASVKAEQQEADGRTTKGCCHSRNCTTESKCPTQSQSGNREATKRPCSRRWQSRFRSECASLKIGIGSLFVQLLTSRHCISGRATSALSVLPIKASVAEPIPLSPQQVAAVEEYAWY
jgi:hypothetical protein